MTKNVILTIAFAVLNIAAYLITALYNFSMNMTDWSELSKGLFCVTVFLIITIGIIGYVLYGDWDKDKV